MTTSSLPAGIMLPNEHERRQMFYWLKQVSSYTAWNRILGFYSAWANVTEASIREASEKGWLVKYNSQGEAIAGVPTGLGGAHPKFRGSGIGESHYVSILKGRAHCEEGVRRLRGGDKRVFKYDANGEFVMADRPSDHWGTMLWRIEIGENGIDFDHTPLWEEFKNATKALNDAWGECSMMVIETSDPRDPSLNVFGDWIIEQFPKMTFPSPLPEVPDPSEQLLVATGKLIPCTGIWEPVDVPKPKGFTLFRNAPVPSGPFPIIGAMNYLHGGSMAPQASLETKDDNPNVDTVWRLLWRDDRYEDGSIPTEESQYVFLQPEATAEAVSPSPVGLDATLYADSGQAAPRAGRWLAENDLTASVTMQQGESLPQLQGRDVRWVLAESRSPHLT